MDLRFEQGNARVTSSIRLVCFDLGRVLIRICDNWQHACRVAGVPVPEYPLPAEVRAQLHGAVAEYEAGRIDVQAFATAASPHLRLSAEQMAAASAAYVLEPFAGGTELLDDLHRRGMRTACLSNTIDTHHRNFDKTSAAGLLNSRVEKKKGEPLCALISP